MIKFYNTIYSPNVQNRLSDAANHLLILIAFFLPISQDAVKSAFFILMTLFLFLAKPITELKIALSNPALQAIIFLWAIHIFGIFYADNITIASHYAGEMKFLLYSVVILIFVQYRFVYRIFTAFILGVFLSELLSYGFFFELLTSPIPSELGGWALSSKNEPSPFTYHVEYGYILALTSAFILVRFLNISSTKERIFLGLFFTTITLNIFLNSARTGYILFIITNMTALIVYYQKTFFKHLIYFLPFTLILFALAWFSSSNLQREYHETVDSLISLSENNLDSSIGNRINMALTAIHAIQKNHLWLGYGSGMNGKAVFQEAIKTNNTILIQWLPDPFYTGYKSILDCTYTDILVQFGLIGIVILFYFFIQIGRFNQPDRTLNVMKHIILSSALFYALVSSLFFGILAPTLLFTLLTFTLIQPDHNQKVLSELNIKLFFKYALAALILFTLSKLT